METIAPNKVLACDAAPMTYGCSQRQPQPQRDVALGGDPTWWQIEAIWNSAREKWRLLCGGADGAVERIS
jgi:hypothetical protein